MNPYYKIFDDLEYDSYRSYFVNEFIPQHLEFESLNEGSNYKFFRENSITPKIRELEAELIDRYNFPPLEYFIVFLHKLDQKVHVDGIDSIRYASLNLSLLGYKDTSMKFYLPTSSRKVIIDARYYADEDIVLKDEFVTPDKWTLVNSGVPHQVTDIKSDDPRVTVCFRFQGNPTFMSLLLRAQKKWTTE
jgi:hypothetical protein